MPEISMVHPNAAPPKRIFLCFSQLKYLLHLPQGLILSTQQQKQQQQPRWRPCRFSSNSFSGKNTFKSFPRYPNVGLLFSSKQQFNSRIFLSYLSNDEDYDYGHDINDNLTRRPFFLFFFSSGRKHYQACKGNFHHSTLL